MQRYNSVFSLDRLWWQQNIRRVYGTSSCRCHRNRFWAHLLRVQYVTVLLGIARCWRHLVGVEPFIAANRHHIRHVVRYDAPITKTIKVQETQLPLRNRASAVHVFVAQLLSIAVISITYVRNVWNLRSMNRLLYYTHGEKIKLYQCARKSNTCVNARHHCRLTTHLQRTPRISA